MGLARLTAKLPPCRTAATEEDERLRLNNLSPQPGSKKNTNRKGRGYGAGQVRRV